MKYFLMFILLLSDFVHSQENNHNLFSFKQNFNTEFILINDFELSFTLNNIYNTSKNVQDYSNPKTIGLMTSFAVSQSYTEEPMPVETKSFMLSPLTIKYREDLNFNSVRYVLGIAQTAAVGYMAYIHLKKYGFFK